MTTLTAAVKNLFRSPHYHRDRFEAARLQSSPGLAAHHMGVADLAELERLAEAERQEQELAEERQARQDRAEATRLARAADEAEQRARDISRLQHDLAIEITRRGEQLRLLQECERDAPDRVERLKAELLSLRFSSFGDCPDAMIPHRINNLCDTISRQKLLDAGTGNVISMVTARLAELHKQLAQIK